jgi:hypothetical protein
MKRKMASQQSTSARGTLHPWAPQNVRIPPERTAIKADTAQLLFAASGVAAASASENDGRSRPMWQSTWQSTDATVRDLHRAILPDDEKLSTSQSTDELRLADRHRLYPDVGTASQTAQPGGFRRAHLKTVWEEIGQELTGYAATPLVSHLNPQRRGPMLTGATITLLDGTEVRYRSRAFRKGRMPQVLHLPDGSLPEVLYESCHIWRPRSVPFWGVTTFLIGAILFTEGSVAWMLPHVGDEAHGADPKLAEATVAMPYFIGSLWFGAGCYLAFVEVINANLQEELNASTIDGAMRIPRLPSASGWDLSTSWDAEKGKLQRLRLPAHRLRPPQSFFGWLRGLSWWRAQTGSLLWWGVFVQLIAGVLFSVACVSGLPGMLPSVGGEVVWIYTTSLLGSIGFVFNSWVFVLEESHDEKMCAPSVPVTIGFVVAWLNLLGSILFLVASLGYFLQDAEIGLLPPKWHYPTSEWGVRFTYGVGSFLFFLASCFGLVEILVFVDIKD